MELQWSRIRLICLTTVIVMTATSCRSQFLANGSFGWQSRLADGYRNTVLLHYRICKSCLVHKRVRGHTVWLVKCINGPCARKMCERKAEADFASDCIRAVLTLKFSYRSSKSYFTQRLSWITMGTLLSSGSPPLRNCLPIQKDTVAASYISSLYIPVSLLAYLMLLHKFIAWQIRYIRLLFKVI